MIYEVSLSSGDITEYETLENLLSMLNEDSSIDDSVFFQSLYSAQHKQRAIRKENDNHYQKHYDNRHNEGDPKYDNTKD